MRLWHQDLIPKLPRQQLLGQWRECLALLGNGWGKKHKTVDYVFHHGEWYLVAYTLNVHREMHRRGYKANLDLALTALRRRGFTYKEIDDIFNAGYLREYDLPIYPEHDNSYYSECINNLKSKGIDIADNMSQQEVSHDKKFRRWSHI